MRSERKVDDKPVVLSLKKAEFLLDTITRIGNSKLERLAGLMRALSNTTRERHHRIIQHFGNGTR